MIKNILLQFAQMLKVGNAQPGGSSPDMYMIFKDKAKVCRKVYKIRHQHFFKPQFLHHTISPILKTEKETHFSSTAETEASTSFEILVKLQLSLILQRARNSFNKLTNM